MQVVCTTNSRVWSRCQFNARDEDAKKDEIEHTLPRLQ